MTFTTLEAHCAAAGTPYHVLAPSQAKGLMVQKRLREAGVYHFGSPLVYCGLAQDVHVYGRSFLHTKAGEITHCQSYQNYNAYNWADARNAFIQPRDDLWTEWLGEECVFFGGMNIEATPKGPSYTLPGAANFGHFIFEYLNRLVIFDALGLMHLPFVVYDCLPKRYLEWLKLFGVRKFIFIPPSGSAAFRKLWVSSAPHYRGADGDFRIWSRGLYALREMAWKLLHVKQSAGRRIYIGREDAEWRKLINEDAVKAELAQHGFELPHLALLSPADQITIMRDAELVVAAAGAGTILTHFAPDHCVVIPLYSDANFGTGPWGGLGAACVFGQTYERLNGSPVWRLDRLPNVAGADERADFHVDIGELRNKVIGALGLIDLNQTDNALDI